MRQGNLTATIASGDTVSGTFDLTGGGIRVIGVPALTSGDLLLQGSFNTTSADFSRVRLPVVSAPVSGDLRIATGPGSCTVLWPDNLPSPSYGRLETGVAQTAPRSFTIRFGGK